MERMYISRNGVVEKTRFVVPEGTRERKWRKVKGRDRNRRKENDRSAVRQLARFLNCNADSSGYLVTLNFSDRSMDKIFAGMDQDQALEECQRQGSLFFRRLKRRQDGRQLCYAFVASDMDGKTGELVRRHIHAVIMGADAEAIRESWRLGDCTDIRHLWSKDDFTGLAAYLIEQVREVPGMMRFIPSRGANKPEIRERVVEGSVDDEIKVQPGARVLDRSAYTAGSVVQYVRYLRRPPRKKRGGHKEGAKNDVDDETEKQNA